MRIKRLLSGLVVAALVAVAPLGLPSPFTATAVEAQEVNISFNLFFDRLAPHGVWVKHTRYKFVWCPRVEVRWRPYTRGHWVFIRDRGWYFESREPFAWAVYHYGRWVKDRGLGWCWVPGRHWAPAWVSWRRSNDFVGWAPLPPEDEGFQISIEVNVGEPPEDHWAFVPVRSFIEPDLTVNIIFADEDPEPFRRTEFVGPVIIQNNIVINNIIDIDFIQQQTNTTVEVVDAKEVTDPAAAEAERASGVPVIAPTLEEPAADAAPPAAVEPEQAAEELGRPAEGAEPGQPADEQAAPAEGEAAPAEGEAAPADEAAPVQCPEGQELVEGKCVPIATEEQPAPAEEQAPAAEEQQAPAEEQAAPEEQAPAEEAAPSEETAPPAEVAPEDGQCPEGYQLVEGRCVLIQ